MSERLLLIHGFTQTETVWDPVIELVTKNYTVSQLRLPGHGGLEVDLTLDFVGYCRQLADHLKESGTTTVVGYSMGGRVALTVATLVPELIKRLVLISASPGIEDPAARAERLSSDLKLAERIQSQLSLEQFALEWGGIPLFEGQSAEVKRQAYQQRMRSTSDGLAAALRQLSTGSMPPLWQQLERLSLPVELVVGERDSKFVSIAQRMSSSLKDVKLHVIRSAGHAVLLEQPQAVAKIIDGQP